MSLNNEPYLTRPTLIDLIPFQINYDSFMIMQCKCNGTCTLLMTYLQKYVFQVKQRRNVKVFKVITRIYGEKALIKHIFHAIENANSIVQYAIQIKNETMMNVNVSVKIIVLAKKILAGILAHVLEKIVGI